MMATMKAMGEDATNGGYVGDVGDYIYGGVHDGCDCGDVGGYLDGSPHSHSKRVDYNSGRKTHEENVRLQHYPLKYFISGGQKPKWSNLRIQSLRKFVNRLNSEKAESKKTEKFLEKYAELKVELPRSMIYKERL